MSEEKVIEMDREQPAPAEDRVGFLLVPDFSMIGLFSAVEPLRVANRASGKNLYSWHLFSEDGAPVAASNGLSLLVESSIDEVRRFPTVIVCASFDAEKYESKKVLAWLRRLDRQGSDLGGIDTGAHVLAKAGLLNGYRATLHWENMPGFSEAFPDVNATGELYEIDRRRFTSSGGTGALDMILSRISAKHGHDLAVGVSESLLHARIRSPEEHQNMTLGLRLRARHPALLQIVQAMEDHLEDPLSLDDLANIAGISRRQLERLFRNLLDDTPSGFYLKLRLRRARYLLEQTAMSILDVSLACGFVSPPYFSRAYRGQYGFSPREDRRRLHGARMRTGRMQ
ncbi:MAG: GlxA family transcriptional regulator [Pseudomonadota bacterium]